jgi:hypothetical protein
VTSEPDVVESTVTEDWEFILLACDGIWDVMSNQQVCDFILKRLALNMQPENICEELMDRCVRVPVPHQVLEPQSFNCKQTGIFFMFLFHMGKKVPLRYRFILFKPTFSPTDSHIFQKFLSF